MNTLDQKRITALTGEILAPIRANYLAGPISPDRAFEALNALAVAASVVIKGCDGAGGNAHDFFTLALDNQLDEPGNGDSILH